MSKTPWQTKEWKERRKKVLVERNACELCGSTENLHIHHPNSTNRKMIRHDVLHRFYQSFCHEYNKEYPTKEEIDIHLTGEVQHKHAGVPNWHCETVEHKNNYHKWCAKTIRRRYGMSEAFEVFNSERWHQMYDEAKEVNSAEIRLLIDELVDIEDKKYMEFEDIQVLCKRCHFAHHKGMDLCPVCKKYKKKQYKTCYDCMMENVKNCDHECFHCKKKPAKKREDGYYECDECYAGYKEFEKMMPDH
jgi:hypothetical protein